MWYVMIIKDQAPLGEGCNHYFTSGFFPLHYADSIIFARQLISKGSDAGGTADNVTENMLSIRGDTAAP